MPPHKPQPEPVRPRWASYDGAAAYAGVSKGTIANLRRQGRLDVHYLTPKTPRIDLNQLDELMGASA